MKNITKKEQITVDKVQIVVDGREVMELFIEHDGNNNEAIDWECNHCSYLDGHVKNEYFSCLLCDSYAPIDYEVDEEFGKTYEVPSDWEGDDSLRAEFIKEGDIDREKIIKELGEQGYKVEIKTIKGETE